MPPRKKCLLERMPTAYFVTIFLFFEILLIIFSLGAMVSRSKNMQQIFFPGGVISMY